MNDEITRAAYTIEEACRSLQPLFGQGYGSNLDQLIEQLDQLNRDNYDKRNMKLRPIQFEHRKHTPMIPEPFTPAKWETLTLTGLFHQFSTEGDGQDIGPVAIIETPDGQIYTPTANNCKFLDKQP